MEELHNPQPEEAGKIELYTRDEAADMLGDMPEWFIHTGSYLIYGLVALLLAGSAVFKYPDVVTSTVNIDDYSKVNWITANRSGIIDEFFVNDGDKVRKNDTLGIIRNAASLADAKRFRRVLTGVEWYYRTDNPAYLEHYPFDLVMGDMSEAYGQFTQAVRVNLAADQYNAYLPRKTYLQEELRILQKDTAANELALLNVRRNLFELELEQKRQKAENRRLLELAYESMVNSLLRWENDYLIKSGNEGTVVLGKSWSRSNRVEAGDTLCSVVSEFKGHPVGHLRLNEHQIADIRKGDRVNIELSKYPAHSYGHLIGEVASISYVPSTKSYAVELSFPYGLRTTSKDEITYELGLKGKAEIITSSRSVLSRILGPLKL